MNKRRIGKSGMVVSEIGLGTMTFGTQTEKAESLRVMDASIDAGINFFDTAEIYPVPPSVELAGLTEDWIGEWLANKPRECVLIASKVAGPAHGWFDPPVRHHNNAIDGFMIRRALEGSLKRLKTDYIDLYQVHWPDHGMRPLDAIETLNALVKEGKIRSYGVSNETCYGLMKWIQAAESAGLRPPDSIQNNFSLNNRRFLDELADCCIAEGVSLLPYSPLAGGVLSGKYNGGRLPDNARFSAYFKGNDRIRMMAERFVNPRAEQNTKVVHEMAHELSIDPITFAIAWSKQHDFVASTLVGVRSLEQLQVHVDAAEVVIPDDVIEALTREHQNNLYPMG